MSGVRVLVGTRKGAFTLTSDGTRGDWTVDGPHFGGWEIYHVNGSPADPNRLYASPVRRLVRAGDPALRRRRQDLGRRSATTSPTRARSATTSGTTARPRPWEFKRIWHLEPSRDDPDTVYAGAEDAALYVSTRRRPEVEGAHRAAHAPDRADVAARAPAACACTRSSWTRCNKDRIYVAISAAGAFRSDDAGASWLPINKGLRSGEIPDEDAEVGHCVHRITQHPSRPDTLFMQKHWDVMRTDDAGGELARDQRRPAVGLRLPDRGARARAGDHLRRADQERLRALPAGGQAARLPQPHRRRRVGAADQRPAAVRLLRQRLPRRDGGRHARPVRHLLRHDRRPGLPLGRQRRHAGRRSSATCRPCSRSKSRCCRDPGRPPGPPEEPGPRQRRGPAGGAGPADGPVTQRAVLDALEAQYPMLLGTIRDRQQRQAPGVRPLLRVRGGPVQRVARRPAARAGRSPARSRSSSSARWPAAERRWVDRRPSLSRRVAALRVTLGQGVGDVGASIRPGAHGDRTAPGRAGRVRRYRRDRRRRRTGPAGAAHRRPLPVPRADGPVLARAQGRG